jgi:hypothetical protein
MSCEEGGRETWWVGIIYNELEFWEMVFVVMVLGLGL